MAEIELIVYGGVVPQGRPRATAAGGRVRLYDPTKSRDYKDYIRLAAVDQKPEKPLEGSLRLGLAFYTPIPKSFSKKKHEQALMGDLRPTKKPDVSNLTKGIEDALNGIIWRDDSQIVELMVSKWYSESPRVEIVVTEL